MSLIIKTPADLEDEAKDRQKAAITARRDQALQAGVTVGSVTISTDDTSQSRIIGAAVAVMDDPDVTVNWKGADGQFHTLDAATILAVARTIRAHVQACFDREAELLADLKAGEPYDIDAGWPE